MDVSRVHARAAEGELLGSAPLVEISWDIECAGHNGFCEPEPGEPLDCVGKLLRVGGVDSTHYVLRTPSRVVFQDEHESQIPAPQPPRIRYVVIDVVRDEKGAPVVGADGVFASATGRTCAVEQDFDPERMQRSARLPRSAAEQEVARKRRRRENEYGEAGEYGDDDGDVERERLAATTHIGSLMRRRDGTGRCELRFARASGIREVHIAYDGRVATEPSRAVVVQKDVERVAGDDPIIQICGTVRIGNRTVLRHALVLKGCTPFTFADKDGTQSRVVIEECESEALLLLRWQDFVRRVDPDLLYGFNTSGFDIEYVWKRAERLGLFERNRKGGTFGWLARSLAPAVAGKKSFTSGATGSNEMYHLDAPGRVAFDVLWAVKRMGIKMRSFSLNSVALKFLGDQKNEMDPTLMWEKQCGTPDDRAEMFVLDCNLVERLVAKLCIVVQQVEMARLTGVCMQQLFDRGQGYKIISQLLKDEKVKGIYAIPTLERDAGSGGKNSGDDKYEGAIVVEAKRGYYAEVDPETGLECCIVILDFASLYPSIMRAHNQCYTTIFHTEEQWRSAGFSEEDVEKTPDGCPQVWFLRAVDEDEGDERRGVLPVMLKRLIDARNVVKGIMKTVGKKLTALQYAAAAELLPEAAASLYERMLAARGGDEAAKKASKALDVQHKVVIDAHKTLLRRLSIAERAKLVEQAATIAAERDAFVAQHAATLAACKVARDAAELHDSLCKALDKLVKNNEALLATHATAEEMDALEVELAVLDGRQLALKVSANSIYGFTGATVGKLPCVEIAAGVTAWGREMIEKTIEVIEAYYTVANGYVRDADVVYGDTDSVFINFGPVGKERAIELGHDAAKRATACFRPPVKLVFEKFYFPFLLMSAKRYAGLYHTRADIHDYVDSKGTEKVRRDIMPIVTRTVEKLFNMLLLERDAAGAQTYVRDTVKRLQLGDVPIHEVTRSAQFSRPIDEYDNPDLAHLRVVRKRQKREPANAFKVGDRVPYAYARGTDKKTVRAEDPIYMVRNGIEPDELEAIEQLRKPVQRILGPVMAASLKRATIDEAFGQAAPKKRRYDESHVKEDKEEEAALVDRLLARQPIGRRLGTVHLDVAYESGAYERRLRCLSCGTGITETTRGVFPAVCATCRHRCSASCVAELPENPQMPKAAHVAPPPKKAPSALDLYRKSLPRGAGPKAKFNKAASDAYKALARVDRKGWEDRAKAAKTAHAERVAAYARDVAAAEEAYAAEMLVYEAAVAVYQAALERVDAGECESCAGRVAELCAEADANAATWAGRKAALRETCLRCTRGNAGAADACVNWDCATRFEREQALVRVAETTARCRRFEALDW